ncbi:MAG: hypothetical protein AAB458_01030 [Patescibacteria group bacterium]
MKVANGQEPTGVVPVVVPPVEVEVPLRVVPIEVRDVAVAIDQSDGAMYDVPSVPPPLEPRINRNKVFGVVSYSRS